jgi:hypothetical protein
MREPLQVRRKPASFFTSRIAQSIFFWSITVRAASKRPTGPATVPPRWRRASSGLARPRSSHRARRVVASRGRALPPGQGDGRRRDEHIRRVANVGDIGWRLREQFHAVQCGPVAFLAVAVLVTAPAVSWIAVLRRQTVIGGAVPWAPEPLRLLDFSQMSVRHSHDRH